MPSMSKVFEVRGELSYEPISLDAFGRMLELIRKKGSWSPRSEMEVKTDAEDVVSVVAVKLVIGNSMMACSFTVDKASFWVRDRNHELGYCLSKPLRAKLWGYNVCKLWLQRFQRFHDSSAEESP